MRPWRTGLLLAVILALLISGPAWAARPGLLLSLPGQRGAAVGAVPLAACPPSPNCVSSRASDDAHRITPLVYQGSDENAWRTLRQVVAAQDRADLITAEADYLYAEFTSRLLGFVDDVEFRRVPGQSRIEVRSASRLGESDLGVNRERVEQIRRQFQSRLHLGAAA